MDDATIGALCVSTASILLFLRHLGGLIMHKLDQLDSDLAEAIQTTLGNLPVGGDFEPPNPIQGIIAQLLAERMAPEPIVMRETDSKGRFTRSKPAN